MMTKAALQNYHGCLPAEAQNPLFNIYFCNNSKSNHILLHEQADE